MAAASQPEMHFFFPTVIQVVNLPDAEALNAKLTAAIKQLRDEYKDQGSDPWSEFFTTYKSQNRLYELPGFRDLMSHIQREADAFGRVLGLDPAKPLYLTGCWLNVYGEGHSQDLHVHTGQVISGCYYVKAPPGVPGLSIFSPFAEEMFDSQYDEQNGLNAKFIEVPAVAGEMLLFRSWTRHCVRPNRTKDERISIAFNFTV
ncbi:MAG: TIGR02466 family protein [Gemmatimonas sp.]